MSNRALFLEIAVLAIVGAACTSDTSLGRSGSGEGGSPAGAGGTSAGGADVGNTGGTFAAGAGGMSAGGAGGRNTGGAFTAGAGGSEAGGSPGTKDAAPTDAPTSGDGTVECAPGYAIGSTRPAGDGCNTCTCQASGRFVCTASPCPAPDASSNVDVASGSCSQLTTQAACEARSDCHPVFRDPGNCGCATAGCCARFSACADGGKAVCAMPATIACTIVTPHCESPYVVSYTKVCYEGCVLQSECAGTAGPDAGIGVDGSVVRDAGTCPATEPSVGSACNVPGLSCEYGGGACCGQGYTCSGGVWQRIAVACPCAMPLPDAGSDARTCSSNFTSALTKDCASDADCTLAKHNDCCGNVVMGIRTGTTTSFNTAEQAFQACECTQPTGCFHADTAEDGSQLGTVGESFVARCQMNRCTSTTARACTTDSDCPGQVCVAYVTHTGPTTSTMRECRSNPCNNTTASCGCAAGLCTTAGFPLCSVVGAQLTCDDGKQ